MNFNGNSIGEMKDKDDKTIDDSLSRHAGSNLEGKLELSMIDPSDPAICKLLNHLSKHA